MSIERARQYADEIMPLACIPDDCKQDVRSLVQLAWLQGRAAAIKEEIDYRKAVREEDC